MAWTPLHLHTHFSLLDGLSKGDQVAGRLVECGYTAAAITDHGSLSGIPSFVKALKTVCKCGHPQSQHVASKGECCARVAGTTKCACGEYSPAKLKALLGCEFYIAAQDAAMREEENRALTHLCVIAKNLQGWKKLMRASSLTNSHDYFYYRPRLHLEKLAEIAGGDLIVFSGHCGTDIANAVFGDNFKAAYAASTYEKARSFVATDWKKRLIDASGRYQELFGRDNFFLEVNCIDKDAMPAQLVVAHAVRIIAKKLGIPAIAAADSHYPRKEDARDQRILLCAAMKTTLAEVARKADNNEEVGLGGFFRSNRYHIPELEEVRNVYEEEEILNTLRVTECIEDFDILGKPVLPSFESPNGDSEDYFRKLCEEGFTKKVSVAKAAEYRRRLHSEQEVLLGAGLAPYFLIVHDYCGWARRQGWRLGRGRGSAAGSLVSYLLDITSVDPIQYNLLFERFYNAGRNAPGRVALPDIDCDFPATKRDLVKDYIRKKYGDAHVADMSTFATYQGRGALKEVLRVHAAVSASEMNDITKGIPDKAKIDDQLQEMREETGEASILRWVLENDPKAVKEYCWLRDDGVCDGPMAMYFEQAMRLEGVKHAQGKHPSGLIISPVPLADVVPMIYDKRTKQNIIGVEMNDAEAMGLVKFDVLGTTVLDKIMAATNIARTGRA